MKVYKVEQKKVELQYRGEKETANGVVDFNVEDYFNEYNEQYARLIPAALRVVTDRFAVQRQITPSTETITSEADRIIKVMLSKREEAVASKAKDFNIIWADSAPDVF